MVAVPPGSCTSNPYVLAYWDPSRAATAMTCWRKHWLSNIRGLRLNGPESVHLSWGKAYHACCEYFDDLITGVGYCREDATLTTLQYAFELSWDYENDRPRWGEWFTLYRCTDPAERPHRTIPGKTVFKKSAERCEWAKGWFTEIPTDTALTRGGKLASMCRSCGNSIECSKRWLPDHKKKTRANLLRAVALYCDTPGLPPYKFPAGEIRPARYDEAGTIIRETYDPERWESCAEGLRAKAPKVTEVQHILPLSIMSPDNEAYKLVVNMDSIVDHNGWAAIRERKTTGMAKLDNRFWAPYLMNPQIDSYDLAGRVVYADEDRPPRVLLEITRVTEGGAVEIARQVIEIPEGRAEEWFTELQELILDAEYRSTQMMDVYGPDRSFPRNTTACHGKFGTCAFWRVCTAAPHEREQIISEDYHVEPWDPLRAERVMEEIE